MFLGEYQHQIDQKGRVVLPAKFREEMADGLVVTKSMEHCLFVYTLSEWAVQENQAKSLSMFDQAGRDFKRIFFSPAAKAVPDKQGRFVIPQNLRDYANLDKDIVVIGTGEYVEIWDKEEWAKYSAVAEAAYPEIAEKLASQGL